MSKSEIISIVIGVLSILYSLRSLTTSLREKSKKVEISIWDKDMLVAQNIDAEDIKLLIDRLAITATQKEELNKQGLQEKPGTEGEKR